MTGSAATLAWRERQRARYGRVYTDAGHDRWVEGTAREVELLEASGGLVGDRPDRGSFSLHATAQATAIPRLFEVEELARPIADCPMVRGAYERHTPPVHPLTDPDYFERDSARLPRGFAEGLTFEPALPERTSWELSLGATAGYRRRLAARRDPDRALARAAILQAKAERLLAEARALSAAPLPSKDLTFGDPENA